jgi:hypothetical protein
MEHKFVLAGASVARAESVNGGFRIQGEVFEELKLGSVCIKTLHKQRNKIIAYHLYTASMELHRKRINGGIGAEDTEVSNK